MNLANLATFITTKVNQSEAEDVAACKTFIQRRRDMIWADALWKDSLGEYTQSLSASGYTPASTWLPTQKILLIPSAFEAVVAARTAERYLNVERSEIFYRTDFDTFASTGTSRQYRLLPPAVWQFDTDQTLAVNSAAADAGQTGLIDTVPTNGISPTRTALGLGAAASVATVGTILAISKTVTSAAVTFGTSSNFLVVNNSNFILGVGDSNAEPGNIAQIAAGQSATIVPPFPGKIFFFQDGAYFGTNVDLQAATGTETVTDINTFAFSAVQTTSVTMGLTDLNALKRQRIQLLGALADPTIIRVLGKLRAPTFTNDNDDPGLTGIDNCLIAFAQADMLERERQYSKAQVCMQEGQALLAQLKRVETVQQAHNQRFVPEHGYGDDWNLVSGSPISF